MKKIAAILLLFSFVMGLGFSITAEAASKPVLRAAEREMRKQKDYDPSDLYQRAHRLIYGKKRQLGPDGRTRIAVVITGDERMMIEDGAKNKIYEQLREKFPWENFAVIKGTDVMTRLLEREERIYASEREKVVGSVAKDLSHDTDGVKLNERAPRGFADLVLKDYVDVGRAGKYDYIFALTLNNGNVAKVEEHNFIVYHSTTIKQSINVRVRLVDVNAGNYAYRNDMSVEGKEHNAMGSLVKRSVARIMQEAMNDIEIVGLDDEE